MAPVATVDTVDTVQLQRQSMFIQQLLKSLDTVKTENEMLRSEVAFWRSSQQYRRHASAVSADDIEAVSSIVDAVILGDVGPIERFVFHS